MLHESKFYLFCLHISQFLIFPFILFIYLFIQIFFFANEICFSHIAHAIFAYPFYIWFYVLLMRTTMLPSVAMHQENLKI